MKKTLILQLLLSLSLFGDITLSTKEDKDWQIQTALAQEVSHVPLGDYMMSVTTPPNLFHTISVPYEAQVVELKKVAFEKVEKGEVLAQLKASEWIEAQRKAIADSIELMHYENEAQRKSKLCKEEIIAQKECTAAESEVKISKIKLSASKTLLKAYGASDEMIQTLSKELNIFPNIKLLSPVGGVLLQVNIQPGNSVSQSSALFVIKTDGQNWLDGDLPQAVANTLNPSQDVIVTIEGSEIKSKLLLMSPSLNPLNQTRYARFSLPKESKLLAGSRLKAQISVEKKAFLVNKKAVIQDGENTIVFVKEGQTYKTIKVNVIAEDTQTCYLSYDEALNGAIAISTTSILQNMLQQRGE